MGLKAGPCQMKAYRNLFSKFERTLSVTDVLRSGRPKINNFEVAEVLQKNRKIANTDPLAISSVNLMSKRLRMPYTTILISGMIFLSEYWLRWKLNPNGYPAVYGHMRLISFLMIESILKTAQYGQQKIHMKSFRIVFVTRKSPFGAVSQLISSLVHFFFRGNT
ncbi:hypothetical protein ILUMI_11550 [Ignelater luminosus]|uniref:Uncharacterized protein n=1 Tax=Ignelater luminosus TaxID=2038154 RepID=A0A8K0CVS7_IGNLU|nr:hypothetical protein ILUMI_11550 [Ignelater luminosus]